MYIYIYVPILYPHIPIYKPLNLLGSIELSGILRCRRGSPLSSSSYGLYSARACIIEYIRGLGFRVSGLGFQVWGLRFGV